MSGPELDTFTTFGELLRHLRLRAQLTQRELGLAVGYTNAHITRLENGQRQPNPDVVRARFIEALDLQREPELATRLLELATADMLAKDVSGSPPDQSQPTLPAQRTNLPMQLTRFIGREREIGQVQQLITQRRLVMLTGAGGAGKTRLSLEVAQACLEQFSQGIWLVEFAPLANPTAVPRAIADVFQLPDEPGRTLTQTLCDYLHDKRMLLVLDNCEHVIGVCAELVTALLQTCPELKILATSRETLRVPGELTWRVPPLTMPDLISPLNMEEALHYEAVQLFVEHAAEAQPGFELTSGNIAFVAQVCRQLDGMPLAIEMAAAQVTAMSVQEIVAQLNNSFALLTSGSRMALPRHRTLHATIEWSYNLLTESERVLLARLSVFADGCTADAVKAVCAGEFEVLPLLLQLVHKSLVVADTRSERTRYRLLETIRQFATEKLDTSGESVMIHERLADYLLSLTANRPFSPVITEFVDRQEAELGNLAALMVWSRARPNGAEISLRLLTGFHEMWVLRGHLMEARTWLDEALARVGDVPAPLRALGLGLRLQVLSVYGYSRARWSAQAEEAVALTENSKDEAKLRLFVLDVAGNVALERSDTDAAEVYHQRGLDLAEQTQHKPSIIHFLIDLSFMWLSRNDQAKVVAALRRALHVAKEARIQHDVFMVLIKMSFADPNTAMALCTEEVARQRELRNAEDLAVTLQAYAHQLLYAGDDVQAEVILRECLALWRQLGVIYGGNHAGSAKTMLDLGQVARRRGDLVAANDWYEQSLKEYRQIGIGGRIAHLHTLIGRILLAEGAADRAAATLRRSLDAYAELDNAAGIAMALTALGALAETQGQLDRAARLFAAASTPRDIYTSSEALAMTLWPADRIPYLAEIAAARKRYEGSEYAAVWAEGERMTLEQAVAYARETG